MAEGQNAKTPSPPISISLITSSPTCYLSGSPPFSVSIVWTLSGSRPIWALIPFNTKFTCGIEIRDPERNGRRIGPPSIGISDEDSDVDDGDSAVAKITTDEPYRHTYTLTTKPKAGGLRSSDTWNLKSGKLYHLTLRKMTCKWMYEDEMREGDDAERRKKLEKQLAALLKPDIQATFTAE